MKAIVIRVWPYIIIGVLLGAFIHNWLLEAVISKVLGKNNPFSVFIATFIGVPLYADIFGTIPIAEALLYKGVGIGTIIAFMMGVTTMSIPSLVMLSKVVKSRLLFTFILTTVIGIIGIAYILNLFGHYII